MLRYGLAGGIGLFIAMIGLESGGFIMSADTGGWTYGSLRCDYADLSLGFFNYCRAGSA